jgi:spermidine/putrescine transport system ATP-binding protein
MELGTPITPELSRGGPGALAITAARKVFRTPEGGEVRALDEVTLTVESGEFFVLLGPSGCGKTTLLRAIAGLESLDSGTIYLGDQRLDTVPPYARKVNTVFQSYALFPHLSVAENISFGLEMAGAKRKSTNNRVEEMLALVQLDGLGSRKPNQLSGGQQQRVALARALATEPQVLLLDEPLAALDLKLRRGMQSELKRLQNATGVTFVFVTHDQEEALALGDRIAVFSAGQLRQVGTPQEIYESPTDRFVADFIGEASVLNTAAALLQGLPDTSFASGRSDLVVVRPERVQFSTDVVHARGALTETQYSGADRHSVVTLDDGQIVRIRTNATSWVPEINATVGIRFDEHSLRAVADS